MSKEELEQKYNITIEEKDNLLFVFNATTHILGFISYDLNQIDKSMQFLIKNGK